MAKSPTSGGAEWWKNGMGLGPVGGRDIQPAQQYTAKPDGETKNADSSYSPPWGNSRPNQGQYENYLQATQFPGKSVGANSDLFKPENSWAYNYIFGTNDQSNKVNNL